MYYRPLYLSTLKLPQLIFGYPAPFWIRVLSVVLHAANSVLVALMVSHFFEGNGKRIAAIAAGLLFAAYPYTFEVMSLAANVYQPLITFLVTSSALCYAQYKSQISNSKSQALNHAVWKNQWLWASLILAFISTATCEYGVITPMLVVVVEMIFRWQRRTASLPGSPLPTRERKRAPLSQAGRGAGGDGQSRIPRKLSLILLVYFIYAPI
jgi:hypothetical protein